MRYLTLGEVVELHQRLLNLTGGASGVRDLGLLEFALSERRSVPPKVRDARVSELCVEGQLLEQCPEKPNKRSLA